MKMVKLSDFVINFVADLGVKEVFMLSGGGCMHLVDSLGRCKKIKFIPNLHEQASAICADAYSQYTRNIGVVLVTTGPGGTNAITGVAASWIDSVPLIVISGQVKSEDLLKGKKVRQMGFQEVDIVSLVRPITKYAVTVTDPDSIKFCLEKAVYLAKEGRPGPVWIDIPLDVQAAMVDIRKLKGFKKPSPKKQKTNFLLKFNRLVDLVNKSKRPVILVGNGIRSQEAVNCLKRLVDRLKIPVLTTWKAIDIFAQDDELFIGRPGAIGQRAANFAQQNSDLIITIGARLDLGQVAYNYKNFARGAKKIIVDIDENEIRKISTRVDLGFNMDAKEFLLHLFKASGRIKIDTSSWIKRCIDWKERYPVFIPDFEKAKSGVNTYKLIEVLSDLLTAKDLLVPGSSGSCSEITMQAFKVKKGQRVLSSPGLGSMGFGLPASIGACIASGLKRTVCIVGDGGLQHNIQELELLKRYCLPIKVFVLNNNAYASIRATQEKFFKGHLVACDPSSGVTLPDTIRISQAYGLKAFKIVSHSSIEKKVQRVLDCKGPVICDVKIDPAVVTQPRVVSVMTSSGKMASKPMEDLWPFLDREEFKENMLIKPLKE